MMKNSLDIINKIEKIRAKNNKQWMHLLKLAIKYAPVQAKKTIFKINKNDRDISDLLKKLGKK